MEIKTTKRIQLMFLDLTDKGNTKWVKIDDIRKELVSSKSRLHILKELK